MKIGIISDTHFGFCQGTERENDALDQAEQALKEVLKRNVDFILMAGDLFDSNEPSPEAWKQAFHFFGQLKSLPNPVLLVRKHRDGSLENLAWSHLPVISIHGTHEYRPKDWVNALDVLEKGLCLVHIHAQKVFVKKGSEMVCVQGLSGVPEKVAKAVLQQWNPRPEPGCHNIFVLHQSIQEFLPTDDDMAATISLSDLPLGFDLAVNGHLHWPNIQDTPNGRFLLTGSTVATQMKRLESLHPKGAWVYDSVSRQAEFIPIPRQRKLFYQKLVLENASRELVRKMVTDFFVSLNLDSFDLKPLVRIKLVGSLERGLEPNAIDFSSLLEPWRSKCILSFDERLDSASLQQRIAELRALQENRSSVSSQGMGLLEKELEKTSFGNAFDVQRIFELLEHNEMDKVVELLSRLSEEKSRSLSASRATVP